MGGVGLGLTVCILLSGFYRFGSDSTGRRGGCFRLEGDGGCERMEDVEGVGGRENAEDG